MSGKAGGWVTVATLTSSSLVIGGINPFFPASRTSSLLEKEDSREAGLLYNCNNIMTSPVSTCYYGNKSGGGVVEGEQGDSK